MIAAGVCSSKNFFLMNRSFLILALLSALVLTGCATHRPLQVVEHLTRDTVYLSSQHFDSVYVFRDRLLDRSRDTIYLKDSILEYRYRLLRDTVYQTHVDSIPVLREVEVVREVRHIPWYAKLLSWIGAIALLFLLIRVFSYVRIIK